jgi:RNA recognition motif-containing protein
MSHRLFVGNLSFDATTDSLREIFAQAGEVAEVAIITDRDSGRPRGFGFVTMASAEGAQKAIAELNGATLDGRQLRVNEAEERRPSGGGRFGGGGGGGPRGDRDRKRRY